MLEGIQDDIFGELGFQELSEKMKIRLVNLHVGDMIRYTIPDNYVFQDLYLHSALHEADLVCSAPMMKTHGLAGVTLGMKNFIGAYPGQVYGTVRSRVHQVASRVEPSGTTFAWASKAGMKPSRLDEIEVRGARLEAVRRRFARPRVVPYGEISAWYGPVC